MPLLALAPAIAAAFLSYGDTALFVVALVNVVVAFFAINTILNLGTQMENGEVVASGYKSGAVAVLTLAWIVAAVLIVVGL